MIIFHSVLVNVDDKKQVLLTYVRQINNAVDVFGMQIKKVTDETDGSSHYGLVSSNFAFQYSLF